MMEYHCRAVSGAQFKWVLFPNDAVLVAKPSVSPVWQGIFHCLCELLTVEQLLRLFHHPTFLK
jgi:hypothetical protein